MAKGIGPLIAESGGIGGFTDTKGVENGYDRAHGLSPDMSSRLHSVSAIFMIMSSYDQG
jgi:hypothetical protein